jgi:hypothetical protein
MPPAPFTNEARKKIGLGSIDLVRASAVEVQNDEARKEFLPMLQGKTLSKTNLSGYDRRKRKDEKHPLCLGYISYHVYHDVY